MCVLLFFVQAEDGIRDLVRCRGLGDVYKRQGQDDGDRLRLEGRRVGGRDRRVEPHHLDQAQVVDCLLYTSDAADERSSVDLGGRRIIKKKHTRTAE